MPETVNLPAELGPYTHQMPVPRDGHAEITAHFVRTGQRLYTAVTGEDMIAATYEDTGASANPAMSAEFGLNINRYTEATVITEVMNRVANIIALGMASAYGFTRNMWPPSDPDAPPCMPWPLSVGALASSGAQPLRGSFSGVIGFSVFELATIDVGGPVLVSPFPEDHRG